MSSKKEKLSSSKFQNMIITDSKNIVGGGAETATTSVDAVAGTSIFRDINPDPCTKWRCDSTCYCSDVSVS